MTELKELIIELFSEEIPARFQVEAGEQFCMLFKEKLESYGFKFSDIRVETTPRRMALLGLVSEVSSTRIIEKKGPAIDAPETAINSFLSSIGISYEQCEQREINGKVYLFAVRELKPQLLVDILSEIVNAILVEFKWRKSMRWGSSSFMWARPLRNVLCVFAGNYVPFRVNCLEKNTTDTTYGHRFLGSRKAIRPTTISEYMTELEENGVVLSRQKRLSIISQRFVEIENNLGIEIDRHEGLLQEVAGLVEYPVVYVGEIPDEYMELPPEILEVSMRVNQRYFCTKRANGEFAKFFVFVSNTNGKDNGETIIRGNQRVLCARLSDAKFFIENDKKTPLSDIVPRLKSLSFYEGLGNMYDKTKRLVVIAGYLKKYLKTNSSDLEKAALYSKCDLKTEIVGEFPEVQGIMGGYYSKLNGDSQYVYNAIREQYLPLGGKMPKTECGSLLAIADKIDSLVCFFALGKGPTGSKDPFALRRAAIGILKIVHQKGFEIDNLREILDVVFAELCKAFPQTKLDISAPDKVMSFLNDRLKVMFKEQGIRTELANCFSDCNLLEKMQYGEYLNNWIKTEIGIKAIQVYKRAAHFQSDIANVHFDAVTPIDLDSSLFVLEEEKTVAKVINALETALTQKKSIDWLTMSIGKSVDVMTAFFDAVLINCEDVNLRQHRLEIVGRILRLYNAICDFSFLI